MRLPRVPLVPAVIAVALLGAATGVGVLGQGSREVGNPFAAGAPYRETSGAVRTAVAHSAPRDRALLRKITGTPVAHWVGDWEPTGGVDDVVRRYTRAAARAGRTGVLVTYALPGRDCGDPTSGLRPAAYARWVSAVADGLRDRRTAVVVEPDALAGLDSCPGTGQRSALLRRAVRTLAAAGAVVYLDAGHSGWVPAPVMAQRLRRAGVGAARGFALNVSNFRTTAAERGYGERLSRLTGGAHFVIDTSRNGRGPGDTWCNPTGRGLGSRPRAVEDGSHLDALLWVKQPGASDGTCGGGPPAGRWWPARALDLARHASW